MHLRDVLDGTSFTLGKENYIGDDNVILFELYI
jgi:hypothetical protein